MTEVRSLDLTGVAAPALSTTSDMPEPGVKPTPPRGAVSAEELRSGGTEQLKEITSAHNREREADARAQALEERLDKTLAVLEKSATRTNTEVKTEPATPRPRRHDFDDPDTYDEALVAWSAKTAAKVTQAQLEKQAQERGASETKSRTEREQQEQMRERMAAWKSAKDKAIEKYPDFQDVTEADDVAITPAMAFSILEENLETGEGFEVAYYLGQHKKEAAKIAALPVQRQGIAIGRLAERLAVERAKPAPVSKAPKPPTSVGGKARATEKSAAEESMEEYAARRNGELSANKRAAYG
jgi:hypothetical protein